MGSKKYSSAFHPDAKKVKYFDSSEYDKYDGIMAESDSFAKKMMANKAIENINKCNFVVVLANKDIATKCRCGSPTLNTGTIQVKYRNDCDKMESLWLKGQMCPDCGRKYAKRDSLVEAYLEGKGSTKSGKSISVKEAVSITSSDLVVRSNSFYCNKNHVVKDMFGIIPVLDKNRNEFFYKVPIAYCESCGVYYILEETYKELKQKGIILCPIISKKLYEKTGGHIGDSLIMNEVSPLKLWGYNVSEAEGLTTEQRHRILGLIIDRQILTKDRVMSYLDFFSKVNVVAGPNAISKWKEDRKFVANYKIGSSEMIIFKSSKIISLS